MIINDKKLLKSDMEIPMISIGYSPVACCLHSLLKQMVNFDSEM